MVITVAIGSKNPSKIKGIRAAFEKMFKTKINVLSRAVKTSLPPQPIGLKTTIRGAIERAVNVKAILNKADFYVGLEAGLIPIPATITGYMDFQVAAILDNYDKVTIGFGPGFEFPSSAIHHVLAGGKELEEAMIKISGIGNIGDSIGAIGFLTNNLILREHLSEIATIMALIPRFKRELYEDFPNVYDILKEL